DVFEEQGVVKTPFYGGFGLIAEDGIPKPSYDAFMLLHELGDQRLPAPANEAIATRRADGTLVIAAWNLVEPDAAGSAKTIAFDFQGVRDGAWAEIRRVDAAPCRGCGAAGRCTGEKRKADIDAATHGPGGDRGEVSDFWMGPGSEPSWECDNCLLHSIGVLLNVHRGQTED